MSAQNREDTYRQLEATMLKRRDYVTVPIVDTGEKLVPLQPPIDTRQAADERAPELNGVIYVRDGVMKRIGMAARLLSQVKPDLRLQVVSGYRMPEIQERLFNAVKQELSAQFSDEEELIEWAHRRVASPDVAGHPTGSAVDIQIIDPDDEPLRFGTAIREIANKDSYTFSPYIDEEAATNRQLLRTVMIASGFAPFNGEWWHFSFGDREWAKYYNAQAATYGPTKYERKM